MSQPNPAGPADWRTLLPSLDGLPLLPCGTVKPRDGGKVPINHRTGRGLAGWATAAFTPHQILAMGAMVKCVGTRTGPDADGLLVFDLDGDSAIAHAAAQGCTPEDAETWLIRRDTATDRLKVTFSVPIELWPLLGHVHAVLRTLERTDDAKGEQIEVFFGVGQVVVAGEHIDSGGHYVWDGEPAQIAEIPPEWWALALEVIEKGSTPPRKQATDGTDAGWHTLTDCPICGRNTHQACRGTAEGNTVLCFHGGEFHPPKGLKPGDVITGRDRRRWAFCGVGRHHGDFSTFRIDRPMPKDQGIQLRDRSNATPAPARDQPGPTPPERFTPQPGSTARWGHVRLSLDRRLDAFNHCIAALVARERNSLRRIARVRLAHLALDLKTALNQKEVGQLILEHLDERSGNTFHPLTADDRLAMEMPVVEWEVPDCIPRGDLTIFGGRAKVGKTRLANHLVRALMHAEDFIGFGISSTSRRVILVTDDQGDGDSAAMLQQLGIYGHPGLIWSRRFRITERNLSKLLGTIAANPGAVVILDSLRSISRSSAFAENDPEMGSIVYDLKETVVDAGGTLVLIHHCNKANDTTGTEALSGHNAIAGAANTIITLHYMAEGQRLLKKSPLRRLVREARSGPPADLVVEFMPDTGGYRKVGDFDDFITDQQQQASAGKLEEAVRNAPAEVQSVLRYLQAIHRAGGGINPPGLLDILKAEGLAPTDARRVKDLTGEAEVTYKRIGRRLDKLDGVVKTERVPTVGAGYFLGYLLTDEGASLVAETYGL